MHTEKTVSCFVVFCDFCRLPDFFAIGNPNPVVLKEKNKTAASSAIAVAPDYKKAVLEQEQPKWCHGRQDSVGSLFVLTVSLGYTAVLYLFFVKEKRENRE